MTNDAIIAVYFNVSIQSEWSIVNICLLVECATWKEALRTVLWFKCRVVCVYVAMLNIKRWTNVTLLISNHFYLILLTQHLQTGNARLLRFFDWAPFLLAGQDSWPVSRWKSSERASASKIPMGRYPNVGWVGHGP